MALSRILTSDFGKSLFLPAHGRGNALPDEINNLLKRRAGLWDLPELPAIGGPLIKQGAVADSQKISAEALGAKQSWYGVNGATGLLQAALLAIARPGQAILMPRNVHRSLICACVLGGLKPILFNLPFNADRGHVSPPDDEWLRKVIEVVVREEIEIAASVLVHPTYQGYANDLKPLVNRLHALGVPVLVDEAHGAHFATCVDEGLPESGITAGADLIVHSLHKSSNGLTQSAILWLQGDLVDPDLVERSIGWLQTTSPSSLLLASCEAAINEWISPIGKSKLKNRLDEAREINFRLKGFGLPLIDNQDPLRLVVHTAVDGITGIDADNFFIARGLVAELPEPGCLTFCLGFSVHRGLVDFIKERWDELLSQHSPHKVPLSFVEPPIPFLSNLSMDCGLAWRAMSERIPLAESMGRVSADLLCPYPPGIPMLIPGERLDGERIEWLINQEYLWKKDEFSTLRVVS